MQYSISIRSDILNTLSLNIVKAVSFVAVLFIFYFFTTLLFTDNKMIVSYIFFRLNEKVALVINSDRNIVLASFLKTINKYYCAHLQTKSRYDY